MAVRIPKGLISLFKFAIAVTLIAGVWYYVNNYRKDDLNKFYLQFDTWGITQVGKAEIDRKNQIDNLADENVPFVQREALKNRTVFLGATDKMVLLALGNPITDPTVNASGQQVWVYSFGDYTRPTYLYFDKHYNTWVLSKAEKASRF